MLNSVNLYLRARRVPAIIGAILLTSMIISMWGAVELPIFTDQGTISTPLRQILPAFAGAVIAMSLTGDLAGFESVAARRIRRYDSALVVGQVVVGLTALSVVMPAFGFAGVLPEVLRNLILWTSVAVLCGRVIGARLGWTAPLVGQLIVMFWGYAENGAPQWWALPYWSGVDGLSWGITVAFLVVAVLSLQLTAWSLSRLR